MSTSCRKHRDLTLKNAYLFGGSICIALVVIETMLRITGYAGDHERRLFRANAEYDLVPHDSWVLQPTDACLSANADQRVDQQICVNGAAYPLRSAEAQQRPRVLVLGDSGVAGWGIPEGLSFPARLATASAGKLSAINAGVYGFHNYDALRLYTGYLAHLETDLVLLGVFMANDLNYNLLASKRRRRWPAPLATLRNQSLDSLATAHFVRSRLLTLNLRLHFDTARITHGQVQSFSRFGLIDERGLHYLDYRMGELAGYWPEGDSPLMEHAYELFARVLQKFEQASRARGARFAVVLLPAPPALAGEYVSPREPNVLNRLRLHGLYVSADRLEITRPLRRVRAICDQLRIPCLDPTAALTAADRATPAIAKLHRVLLPGDDHFNGQGHAILAREVAEWLSPVRD